MISNKLSNQQFQCFVIFLVGEFSYGDAMTDRVFDRSGRMILKKRNDLQQETFNPRAVEGTINDS